MLKILERELLFNYYSASRNLGKFTRPSVFAKREQAGVDMSGKWDETIYASSDVNAY